MIQLIVTYQALIRELINGSLMISCLWCAAIVAYFLVQAWTEGGDWRNARGVKVACALWWLFVFEAYRTGSIWHVYFTAPSHSAADIGSFATVSFVQTLGYLIGGVGLTLAILTCSYLFSPPRHKDNLWKMSLGSTFIFLFVTFVVKKIS